VWHTLRREYAGAWRSVRYDLASRRAAKLAVAFTEEFAPGTPPVPTPSRVVPLTGVALLLAGGAAGAFVAISGGLAAVDSAPPAPTPPPAAAPAEPGTGTTTPSAAPSQAPARRPGTNRTPGPGPIPAPIVSVPISEGSVLPTSPSVEASSVSPSAEPSASESDPSGDGTHTEGPRSRGRQPRR
jgi:hypothetical protein